MSIFNEAIIGNSLFVSIFNKMKDPRRTNKGNHLYPLNEILFLVISAVISGADGWTSIETFGKAKLSWLQESFPYQHGVPSHDVLGKLFARLRAKEFSSCFTEWVNSIAHFTDSEVVAIDGKTIRHSNDDCSSKSAIHLVSAFANENRLCLGQEAVSEKSNEITAIPKLLDVLMLRGCIVKIDAMGCQKKIAEKIIEKEADYILMVKNNHKNLMTQIKLAFETEQYQDVSIMDDSGHGRVESRECTVISDLSLLDKCNEWKAIKSIVQIRSSRYDKKKGSESVEYRYYITSLNPDAEKINKAVRSHWAIENKLHWNLDVIFKEDASLKKKGDSAMNFNIINKIALTLIDREKSTKMSKNSKRLNAALDDKYRTKIIYS